MSQGLLGAFLDSRMDRLLDDLETEARRLGMTIGQAVDAVEGYSRDIGDMFENWLLDPARGR